MRAQEFIIKGNVQEAIAPGIDTVASVKKLWQYANRNLIDLTSMASFENEHKKQPYVEDRLVNLLKTADGKPVTIAFDMNDSLEFENNVLYIPIGIMWKYRGIISGPEFVKKVVNFLSNQSGMTEDEPARIKLGAGNAAARAWITKVYARYPHTFNNNHVMSWGEGDDQELAMFELEPSMTKRGAVEVKWFQAYPLRQGIGSRAMKELQDMAREDGISLTLFPWDKGRISQAKLMKFYRLAGFKPIARGGKSMAWTPEQPVVAEVSLNESAVFLNPTTVVVGQAHGQPLELSPDTLKKIQDIAAKHGAWYEGNGTDRAYTKGQIDRYVGSWDDEVAKTASPNDPKWLYVLFANVDENNRVQRVGVDPKDTIFNRLLATAQDNSFQGIGYTAQALQKFLQMASEGQYDFVKMSQQPATQPNLTRFLKAGEALMWPSNWEQYPNRAGKIAKAATVDVRDQYLATRKAGVYVTGSGHLKAVQNITGQQGVAEDLTEVVDLDTAFPLKWDQQFAAQGEIHASASDADGREIGISFTPAGNGEVTDVAFTRGGTHEMTGRGDAGRVMATVIKAINLYTKKYKPPYLAFSAKSGGGRSSAYTAMIRRHAQGYELVPTDKYPAALNNYLEFIGTDQPFVLART